MINFIEKHLGAILVYEDSETKQLYYQCLCGGIGMYERCLKLNEEETEEYRAGILDHDKMLRAICRENPDLENRIVPPF